MFLCINTSWRGVSEIFVIQMWTRYSMRHEACTRQSPTLTLLLAIKVSIHSFSCKHWIKWSTAEKKKSPGWNENVWKICTIVACHVMRYKQTNKTTLAPLYLVTLNSTFKLITWCHIFTSYLYLNHPWMYFCNSFLYLHLITMTLPLNYPYHQTYPFFNSIAP